jgi:TPR repeat protein
MKDTAEYRLAQKAAKGDQASRKELQREATGGNLEAAFMMGWLHDARDESRPGTDFAVAAKWYESAASQGHALSQYCLANMHDYGNGVAQDDTLARRWYEAAAKQGIRDAQMHLARMFHTGRGGPQSTGDAVHWYGKAVELGDELAATNLGFMHLNKEIENASDSEALDLFLLAAEKQDGLAFFALGVMFLEGRGVRHHIKQALLFFCMASHLLPPGPNQDSAIAAREQILATQPERRKEFEKMALACIKDGSGRIPFIKQ